MSWEERKGGRWEEGGRVRKSNWREVGDCLSGVGRTVGRDSKGGR